MIDRQKYLLPLIAGAVMVLALVFSVFLYIRGNTLWHRYVLFFPNYTNPDQIEGEIRRIRRHEDLETNVDRVIHELMLGPGDIRYYPVMPPDGNVNTIMLRDNELYVDFSYSILFSEEISPLTLSERFQLLTKSILWNFPQIKTINYTINGEVPVDIMDRMAENMEEVKKK